MSQKGHLVLIQKWGLAQTGLAHDPALLLLVPRYDHADRPPQRGEGHLAHVPHVGRGQGLHQGRGRRSSADIVGPASAAAALMKALSSADMRNVCEVSLAALRWSIGMVISGYE